MAFGLWVCLPKRYYVVNPYFHVLAQVLVEVIITR
jgi:hypothetical protein